MKKFAINAGLAIAFILIYFLQVNIFSNFRIARSNAKFIHNISTLYRAIL